MEKEKVFKVTITETLQREIFVYASELDTVTPEAAAALVEDGWKDCEYILDADDFKDVDFKVEEVK